MIFVSLLSFSFVLIGFVAALFILKPRLGWERANDRVVICVDYDDAWSASIRAGISFDTMLDRLSTHGATHLSLPELTIDRLRGFGQLRDTVPSHPPASPPVSGHWNYFHGEIGMIEHIAAELRTRLPYAQAEVIDGETLVFAGDLKTLGGIGLGFDDRMAKDILSHGLKVVPQPVSYPWPEPSLIHRSIVQAAEYSQLVSFAGNVILGHELHLEATVDAMASSGMTFVYFSMSRHQKGDWFLAKRRVPNIILGHRFTTQEMCQLDTHSAVHHWSHLMREHGVRFLFIDFFKEIHALEPLESLHYLEHLKKELCSKIDSKENRVLRVPLSFPQVGKNQLSLVALVIAGIFGLIITFSLELEMLPSVLIWAVLTATVLLIPVLDKPYGDLEKRYPPLYAPKALALLTAALAPVAVISLLNSSWNGIILLVAGLLISLAAAVALAVFTTGPEFQLNIEIYRGLNLDWMLPLSVAAWTVLDGTASWILMFVFVAVWLVTNGRKLDLLASIDIPYPESHVHHISRINRIMGDFLRAIGLRPARKWAGMGPLGLAVCYCFLRQDQPVWAAGAAIVCVCGFAFWLEGFRRPERAFAITAKGATISLFIGSAVALALLSLLSLN